MSELTLEALAAKIATLEGQVGTAVSDAANAVQTANEAKSAADNAVSIAESASATAAAGGTGINTSAKVVEKPEIPEGTFTHKKKKYVFLKAKFRLLGDPTLHLSREAAATAKEDEGLFAKILAIKGQDILKEVV